MRDEGKGGGGDAASEAPPPFSFSLSHNEEGLFLFRSSSSRSIKDNGSFSPARPSLVWEPTGAICKAVRRRRRE